MDFFAYKDHELFCEDVNLSEIATLYGTPTYVYSRKSIESQIDSYKKSFTQKDNLICFSVKSLNNISILNIINKNGCGFDVVSGGELQKVCHVGADPKKIIFSGVGKSNEEISLGVRNQILSFNIESESELYRIEKIASSMDMTANIAIRFNPEIDSGGHEYIKTGRKGDKFGISSEEMILNISNYIYQSNNLKLVGLACHIGSQILDLKSYRHAAKNIKNLANKVKQIVKVLDFLDLGGGLGISYFKSKIPTPKELVAVIEKELDDMNEKIILEPGRSISGNAGVLLTNVEYIKDNFLIVDAAMNDLIRPALYGSIHKILPGNKTNKRSNKTYEFVGPICESTDKFSSINNFQKLKESDLVVLHDVGAYGMSLSSNYNLRLKPIEILIKNSKVKVIRKRQTYKDLLNF